MRGCRTTSGENTVTKQRRNPQGIGSLSISDQPTRQWLECCALSVTYMGWAERAITTSHRRSARRWGQRLEEVRVNFPDLGRVFPRRKEAPGGQQRQLGVEEFIEQHSLHVDEVGVLAKGVRQAAVARVDGEEG